MGDREKKNSFFEQKNYVDRESNLGPLHEKPRPYQLSHRGLLIELNLKYGSTHISLARFLVDPNSVWVHSPFQDVCLLVFCVRHLLAKRKFQKKYVDRESNPGPLRENPLHCHLGHLVLSI